MDQLYDQKELIFRPTDENFDVMACRTKILQIGHSFQDPLEDEVFLICDNDESRELAMIQRRDDPTLGFPSVLLIRVQPHEIAINQSAGIEFLSYSEIFVRWLMKKYPCQITNEYGDDVTDLR